MKTVLLVTNRLPDEAVGRAEKIKSRQRMWAQRGWNVELSHVSQPYVRKFPSALANAIREVISSDIDVVVTMNNPFHLHIIGYLLQRIVGLPWIAEFRDPLLSHPDWDDGDPLQIVAAAIEELTVKNANRVCWLDGIQMPDDYFERMYPDLPQKRFVKLPVTGYDPVIFEDIRVENPDATAGDSERPFTITYAGSFYEGWLEPYGFIEGLGRFCERTDYSTSVQANFYGDWSDEYEAAARAAGVTECIEPHGFVPHEEVIPELIAADALLYIGGTDPRNQLNIPSKIWDYIAAENPILGVVHPEFAVAEFLRKQGVGIVAQPDDPDAVADAIEALVTGDFEFTPNSELPQRYSREHNADAFVDVLDEVVSE